MRSREQMIAFDEDLRNLVREQVSHIGDLQKEVNTLRVAMKDIRKNNGGPQASVNRLNRLPVLGSQQVKSPEVPRKTTRRRVSPRRSESLDRETVRLTRAAAVAVPTPGGVAGGRGGSLDGELRRARQEIDAGEQRIQQLETWLDKIYNDRELGLGPGGKTSRDPGQGQGRRLSRSSLLTSTDRPPWDARTKLSSPAALVA